MTTYTQVDCFYELYSDQAIANIILYFKFQEEIKDTLNLHKFSFTSINLCKSYIILMSTMKHTVFCVLNVISYRRYDPTNWMKSGLFIDLPSIWTLLSGTLLYRLEEWCTNQLFFVCNIVWHNTINCFLFIHWSKLCWKHNGAPVWRYFLWYYRIILICFPE